MHQSLIPPRSSRKGRRGGTPCACWLSQISLRRHPGRTPDLGKFAFSLVKGSRFLLSRRNDDQLRGPSIPPRSSRNGGSAPSGGSGSRWAPRIRHTPRIRHFDLTTYHLQLESAITKLLFSMILFHNRETELRSFTCLGF